MRKILKNIYTFQKIFGCDLIALFNALRGLPFYIIDFFRIKKQKGKDNLFYFGKYTPMLADRFKESGTMSGHYFYQDLFVARKIFLNNPQRHLDIGSRIDGFVAHVASFRAIEIIDIREQRSKANNIYFRKADLMQLPIDIIEAYDSISSLHAIEHFGLGRYGDPIDYDGHRKAIFNITRILKRGGKFYFSVPIGPQRIEFNAHRIFSIRYLIALLDDNFNIDTFSLVNDSGDFFEDIDLTPNAIENNYNCNYGCGIFELTKKQ